MRFRTSILIMYQTGLDAWMQGKRQTDRPALPFQTISDFQPIVIEYESPTMDGIRSQPTGTTGFDSMPRSIILEDNPRAPSHAMR